ncbi:MAG: T9SS type A sorting domain-containing protein [Bacteroidales bacterium]|nr:T9SS type A sorting domain-containing protein [Bacteroidales bacterium]
MKKIYLLCIGLLLSFNSQSQISQINDPMMFGGRIRAYAQNANCVLVATSGGIFKTIDYGHSWTNSSFNFSSETTDCSQIVSIGSDFYALSNNPHGPKVYKSSDNGANWSIINFPNFNSQAIGKLGNMLYAVGYDYMSGGKLYSSSNGIDWSARAILWTKEWQGGNCQLISFSSDRLILLLNDNLYYTTDGNSMTTVSVNGLGNTTSFNGDYDVAGDAAGNLYFLTNNIIYKYNFSNETWGDISTGKVPDTYQLLNISVTNNAIFAVAMTPFVGLKLYRSTNQGGSFDILNSTGLDSPMIERICQLSANNLIGIDLYDQILFSSDGGDSWTSNNNQFISTYAGNLTKSGTKLQYTTNNRGIIRSSNEGLSWSADNNGIPDFGDIAYFVEDIMAVKDTLFSLVRPDPFANDVMLYKSIDNGDSWKSAPIPVPYNSGKDYLFAGKCDSALYISYFDSNTSSYALIVTYKNGASWVKPSSQNTNQRIYLKGPKNCLFAFYSEQDNGWQDFTNVNRANNFGMSFSDINPNQLFGYDFTIKRIPLNRGDKGAPIMDFDLAHNYAIFAVNDRRMGVDLDKLYKYDIGMNQWSEISTTGLPQKFIISFIKNYGSNLWLLATNEGLYKSTNGGNDWVLTHNVNNWQKGITVNSIQLLGNKAFMGTLSNGVWVTDLSSGIVEHVVDADFIIYTNPSTSKITVKIPEINEIGGTVSLYGFDGRQIISKSISSATFELSLDNVKAGSYIVVVNANHRIYRKAIIRK